MVSGSYLGAELLRLVNGGIDIAAEHALRVRCRIHHVPERHVADNEKVDVALIPERITGRGSEDEGYIDPGCQRAQRLSKHIGHASRLDEQRLQFGEDRRLAVCLEIHLTTLCRTDDETRARQ